MESQHRERIFNNLNLLAERTHWNIVLEEKLQTYKIFNSNMIEDLKKVSQTTNNMIFQHYILAWNMNLELQSTLNKFQIDGTNRAISMYEKVTRRGPKAFKNLIRALIDSKNTQAAEILEPVNSGSHLMCLSNNKSQQISSSKTQSPNR